MCDLSAGDQRPQLRTRCQQSGDLRRRAGQLFKVVQNQQHRIGRERACQHIQRRARRVIRDVQRSQDHPDKLLRVVDRSKIDNVDAIGKLSQHAPGDLYGQPGLANPASAWASKATVSFDGRRSPDSSLRITADDRPARCPSCFWVKSSLRRNARRRSPKRKGPVCRAAAMASLKRKL